MTGTAGQQRVPRHYFEQVPFPLPPLAEQRRIVARVEQLLALCNNLKAQLAAGESVRAGLLASLLHGAANGQAEG